MPTINYSERYATGIKGIEEGFEIWEEVLGYEGLYEVSNFGRVKALPRVYVNSRGRRHPLPETIHNPSKGHRYLMVCFYKEKRPHTDTVHSVVLTAFTGPRPAHDTQCRHLDGNEFNNRLDNLRWGTPKENGEDRVRHGTPKRGRQVYNQGEKHPKAKLTDELVTEMLALWDAGGWSYCQMGKQFGVHAATVRAIVLGTMWKHLTAHRQRVDPPSPPAPAASTSIGQ